ncbi:MAG: hypothetical protein IPG01_03305 [Chitinophagaceae bacterium]|nr:hypothetical protein [Chitinophagaceae bacterium]
MAINDMLLRVLTVLAIALFSNCLINGNNPPLDSASAPTGLNHQKEITVFSSIDDALKTPLTAKALYLRDDTIQHINPRIIELKNLERVSFIRLNLLDLPDALKKLSYLQITELELIDCNIERLPDVIDQLKSLETLICIDDSFSLLTPNICSLKNLKNLVVGTALDNLPSEIGKLKNLERLILSENKFTIIPNEICQLSNLVELSLEYNRINSVKAFPECMSQLKKLKSLRLANNPIADREFRSLETYGKLNELQVLQENLPNCKVFVYRILSHK